LGFGTNGRHQHPNGRDAALARTSLTREPCRFLYYFSVLCNPFKELFLSRQRPSWAKADAKVLLIHEPAKYFGKKMKGKFENLFLLTNKTAIRIFTPYYILRREEPHLSITRKW
ncbi:MAG: hypothetical protein IKQ03_00505, partial [Prevotella sp.]|nr:hypothetical protein [Prevotella sp.]